MDDLVHIWVAALLAALACPCWAGTYYVAPGGDDAGPGSLEQPWASQGKIALMKPGDTIVFREGTYAVCDAPLSEAGTESQLIVVRSFPGERVVWENTGLRREMLQVWGSWHVIDGIEFVGGRVYGVVFEKNQSDRVCEHNVIRNCKLHDTSDYCDMIKVHGNATKAAKYVTIENCEFWGKCANFIDVTGEYVEIRENYFHDWSQGDQEQVLMIKGGTIGNSIHDNLFLRCADPAEEANWESGAVIHLGGGMDPGTQRIGRAKACSDTHVYGNAIVGGNSPGIRLQDTADCTIRNNTIALADCTPPNARGPLATIVLEWRSERTTILDNVLVNDKARMIMVQGLPPGGYQGSPSPASRSLVSDYNLFYTTGRSPSWSFLPQGVPLFDWLSLDFPYDKRDFTVPFAAWQAASGQDAHSIVADPLFADPANGDYHLKSEGGRWTAGGWVYDTVTSPAIDAGDPASDYSGEPRPNGGRVNLGAHGNTPQASRSRGPEGPADAVPDG